MAGVIRTGRPLLTPDLTRLGPPKLAAAAAESGLMCSLVVPIVAGGQRFGGLQLLGDARRPPEPAHGEAVQPLLDALAARLVDVRALRRLAVTPTPSPEPGGRGRRRHGGDPSGAVAAPQTRRRCRRHAVPRDSHGTGGAPVALRDSRGLAASSRVRRVLSPEVVL